MSSFILFSSSVDTWKVRHYTYQPSICPRGTATAVRTWDTTLPRNVPPLELSVPAWPHSLSTPTATAATEARRAAAFVAHTDYGYGTKEACQ